MTSRKPTEKNDGRKNTETNLTQTRPYGATKGNEMKKLREFCPGDRYRYDFGLCSSSNGFAQVDTQQDASYYGTWANPEKLIVFSYTEGDCCTTVCDNVEEFKKEMYDIKQWNEENGWKFYGVDPGLNDAAVKKWEDIGLGELLH